MPAPKRRPRSWASSSSPRTPRGDNAAQATNLETAINQGVKAIIIDHGQTETLTPGIEKALAANIPVVAFDANANNPKVPQIEQSDAQLAQLALDQLLADTGGEGDIAYVYVAGFAPLDRRNEVFEEVLAANPGLKNVATFGTVSESTAAEVQTQAAAVLTANPGIKAIFAPYDEFAKGAVLAVEAAGLQDSVKVYGADISTADIAVLTAENSPWVATAGTDPGNVGPGRGPRRRPAGGRRDGRSPDRRQPRAHHPAVPARQLDHHDRGARHSSCPRSTRRSS